MDLIVLYGPPAAGKLTVAKELSRLTGIGVLDNHLSIDLAAPIFPNGWGKPGFVRLIKKLRLDCIDAAAREGISLIHTYVYDHPKDRAFSERLFRAAERHGGRVCLVQLACDDATLAQRVSAPDRVERRKLSRPDLLADYLQRYVTTQPFPGRDSLRIDTAKVEPAAAASRIMARCGLAAAKT